MRFKGTKDGLKMFFKKLKLLHGNPSLKDCEERLKMFYCEGCKKLYSEGEFYWDKLENSHYKDAFCPTCHDSLEEAKRCEVCGEYFAPSISKEVCDDCINPHLTVETAIEIGREEKTSIKINSFAAAVLTEKEIEEWIEKVLRYKFNLKSESNDEVRKFLLEDSYFFSEFVLYKEKNKQWRG